MILVWFLTIALAAWFGFELGRKWDEGRREEIEEEEAQRAESGGVRLGRITMRR